MNAPADLATWIEHGPGSFTVRLSETAAFGVGQDGSAYYVTLPGFGHRKCWNRAEVERVCFDFWQQRLAEQADEDDDFDPPYDAAARADDEYQLRKEGVL